MFGHLQKYTGRRVRQELFLIASDLPPSSSMSPTPAANGKLTPKNVNPSPPAKTEAAEASKVEAPSEPETTSSPAKEETRPYTLTLPVKTLKILALISKVEGKSTSEIVIDAIDKAGLKDRARAALASLANDLGE